jgi:multiple sugar transport system ATP-binding protein
MAKVALNNLVKIYDKQETIKKVNLDIHDKEFIVLVGPSGCGKSTILRMIAGLETITGGEIAIGERIVNEIAPKDRDIAMVFQNYALYPHMNVYDNLAFGLKMRKFKKDDIDVRVKKAAEILHITEYLDRKPRQLSGGQRQRVALGRAIVRDPAVFLMDEPLSNLDAKLRVQMRSELIKLHKELQTTFIYVTHDQVEAMTMGDRIVILNDGIIQQVDEPERIYDNPANMFVAGFIGSPSMNFIRGSLQDNESFKAGEYNIKLPECLLKVLNDKKFNDKEFILGIRPEHIGPADEFESQITSIPTLVEMLGSEKLIHFKLVDSLVTAKVQSDFYVVEHEPVTLSIDLQKAVLFDPETEQRLDSL